MRIYEKHMPGKMTDSDFWIPEEAIETKLTAMIHEMDDEVVVAWGWRPNEGGPDVISVNARNGEVTFWDAKSSGKSGAKMPNVGITKDKMTDWKEFAIEHLTANSGEASPKHVTKVLDSFENGGVSKVRGFGFGTLDGQEWP